MWGEWAQFSLLSPLQGVSPKAPNNQSLVGAFAESALKVGRDPEGRCRGGCDLSSFLTVVCVRTKVPRNPLLLCLFSGEPSSAQILFPKGRNHVTVSVLNLSPHYTLEQVFVLESPARILKRWF